MYLKDFDESIYESVMKYTTLFENMCNTFLVYQFYNENDHI